MSKKIILISILLTSPVLVLAQNATSLPAYISNIFNWSLRIGGLVAFGALVYGGFRYLTSAGNPEAISEAKKYMTGALIGLVVLLGSYLLLNTINPALVNPGTDWKKLDRGVCFYGEGGEDDFYCTSDNEKKPNFGTSTIEPQTVEFQSDRTELIGIYIFKEENWEGEEKFIVTPNLGQDSERDLPFTPKSYYLYWERGGVYAFRNTGYEKNFPEKPFKHYNNDIDDLGDYKGEVKSILFNNVCDVEEEEWVHSIEYAAVLHSKTEQQGNCAIAFGDFWGDALVPHDVSTNRCLRRGISDLNSNPNSLRHSIGYDVSSMTVFNYAWEGKETGKVTFYDQINHAGNSFTVEAEDIEDHPHKEIGHYWEEDISYPYNGSPESLDQILSLKVQGNFLVVLTTQSGLGGRCQALRGTSKSLKGSYILPKGAHSQNRVSSIAIIPLK